MDPAQPTIVLISSQQAGVVSLRVAVAERMDPHVIADVEQPSVAVPPPEELGELVLIVDRAVPTAAHVSPVTYDTSIASAACGGAMAHHVVAVVEVGPARVRFLPAVGGFALGEWPRLPKGALGPAPAAPARTAEVAPSPLTCREREVLRLIGQGVAYKQIAARLHVAESTVKTTVRSIKDKLDLVTREDLVAAAQRLARG